MSTVVSRSLGSTWSKVLLLALSLAPLAGACGTSGNTTNGEGAGVGDVPGATPSPSPGSSDAPLAPAAAAGIAFGDIPELVFVDRQAEDEEMGIFFLDPENRTRPGDLWWRTGQRLERHATLGGGPYAPRSDWNITLEQVSGSQPAGVTYEPTTGRIRYDGAAQATNVVDWTVRFHAKARATDVYSNPFRVRVLRPTAVYGTGVKTDPKWSALAADKRLDPTQGDKFALPGGAVAAAGAGTADAAPAVLFVTGGAYDEDFYIGNKSHFYLLGEPNNRPHFHGDTVSAAFYRTFYLKNLELDDTTIVSPMNQSDAPVNQFITKVYQHDQTKSDNGIMNPNTGTRLRWTYQFWNFNGVMMGDPGNTKHQMYIEGRPDSHLLLTNIRIDGTRASSAVKTTSPTFKLRNSYLSSVRDPANPTASMTSTILLDVPAAGRELLVYNNHLLAFEANAYPCYPMFWRARKTGVRGSDIPAYPSLMWFEPAEPKTPSTLVFSNDDDTNVTAPFTAEIRQGVGDYAPLTIGAATFIGATELGKATWQVTISPGNLPIDGSYQVRTRDANGKLSAPSSLVVSHAGGGLYASSQTNAGAPTSAWSAGPGTFVDAAFWSAVETGGLTSETNPLLFSKFVSYNTITQIAGSKPIVALRDDGTHPVEAQYQFGPSVVLRTHPNWVERSTTFLANNTYEGIGNANLFRMLESEQVNAVKPGARWGPANAANNGRTIPSNFRQVGGENERHIELPAWFRR